MSGSYRRAGRHTRWCGSVERLERRTVLSFFTVQNLNDSGVDSLRAAIEQANFDMSGDTIDFAAGLAGTIDLVSALPALTSHTTIAGPGAPMITVSSSADPNVPSGFPIITVAAGATVTITGLTTMGGRGIDNAGTLTLQSTITTGRTPGFAISSGGGINNAGMLTLLNATVSFSNLVRGSETGLNNAGGIYNFGTLVLENSVVSSNVATGMGGGIDNEGVLTVVDSVISGNSAGTTIGNGVGGGIYNHGSATVVGSSVDGNRALGAFGVGNGGGIYNDGTFILEDTAVNDNEARGGSGGSGGGIDNAGTMSIGNATIARNLADGRTQGFGGGIFNSGTLTSGVRHDQRKRGWGGPWVKRQRRRNLECGEACPCECDGKRQPGHRQW